MSSARSYLFVPGDRPDRFDKAAASGADRVILDLEDAVRPEAKHVARDAVAGWGRRVAAVVRINGAESPWFADDLALLRDAGIVEVMIPKADPEVLRIVRERLGNIEIIALIETVSGLLQLRQVCSGARIGRLAFGNLDFSLDAGIDETDRELDPVRLQLVLESRFAKLPAPIDGVLPSLNDPIALSSGVRKARSLGFGAKLCIHPGQVAAVNDGFLPNAEELAWATRVLTAVEGAAGGAVSVDGKMVDRPVVERARALVDAGMAHKR